MIIINNFWFVVYVNENNNNSIKCNCEMFSKPVEFVISYYYV